MKKQVFSIMVFLMAMQAFAQEENHFAIGNGFADKGQYSQAIQHYKMAIDAGRVGSEIYYNLGNAYLELDSLAQAILAYEKALLIRPQDIDVLNNLDVARNRLPEQLTTIEDFFLIGQWRSFYQLMQANTWAYFTILFMLLMVALVWQGFYRPSLIPGIWRKALLAMGAVSLMLCLMAGMYRKSFTAGGDAMVLIRDGFLKSGPDQRSDDLKQLYGGFKLYRLDKLSDWYKVRTVDREVGWVPAGEVELIELP